MDPRQSAQDVVRCGLCNENLVPSYCEYCNAKLCKPCIVNHISGQYDQHRIVPFQERKSTLILPICKTHSKETAMQVMQHHYLRPMLFIPQRPRFRSS